MLAAEREAQRVRDNAQTDAGRYVDEYRRRVDAAAEERIKELTQLTQSISNRLEALGREADNLVASLRRASEAVSEEVARSMSRRELESGMRDLPERGRDALED